MPASVDILLVFVENNKLLKHVEAPHRLRRRRSFTGLTSRGLWLIKSQKIHPVSSRLFHSHAQEGNVNQTCWAFTHKNAVNQSDRQACSCAHGEQLFEYLNPFLLNNWQEEPEGGHIRFLLKWQRYTEEQNTVILLIKDEWMRRGYQTDKWADDINMSTYRG